MKKLIRSLGLTFILFAAAVSSLTASEIAPKSPLVVPAIKAVDHLKDLHKVSGRKVELHAVERKLLAEADKAKFETLSFSEAALIASGAVDATSRAKYAKQLDEIEAGARKALEGADSVAAKGEKLLKFLHAGVMSKGFSLKQTDLTGILDTGRYNCVSSSVLYNVMARRLGLDVKAMVIAAGPGRDGHVFSVLCDGEKMIPVETTHARGFNGDTNMKKKNKREIGDIELVGGIYYNHGVGFAEKKCYHEALLANLCALTLDKANQSAAVNVLADLTNWGIDLSQSGKPEIALEVVRVGLALAPKDAKLLQNRTVFIQDIVLREVKAGKYSDALTRIEKHKALLAAKDQTRLTVTVHDMHADTYRGKGEWEKVVQVYGEALKQHPNNGHLKNNLLAGYHSWARTFMDKSDWAGAIAVYEQGLRHLPGNSHLANNRKYCQEQLKRGER